MTKDRRNLCLTRKTIAEIEQLRDEELRSFSTMGEILCGDIAKLMRTHSVRSKDEKEAFNAVIDEFFVLSDSGYNHEKCDQELTKIYNKSAKARASAKARWEKHDATVMRTHSECNANGMLPNTYNLTPNNLTPKVQEIVPPKEKAKPRTKFKQPESNDVFDYLLPNLN